jgi:uncharacterized protein YndB with AHSA1/START domain/DNA-binding transcriptional ArsR family regulator
VTQLQHFQIFNQKVDNLDIHDIFNHMVDRTAKGEQQLSLILKVTSNVTRRSILTTLVQEGPTRVTDLAEHYAMSLNAVSKHIKALEAAGLVSRKKLGREHFIEANLEPIKAIDKWFQDLRSIWEIRLERLGKLLEEEIEMLELSVRVSRTIKAPIEAVYNAWLNPTMLARFMLPGEGMSVPRAESDAREGGRFSIIMKAGDQELPHGGEYQKLDPFSKIIFSWESPYSVEGSTVTLTFTEVDEGTHVELVHVKFLDEESRGSHEVGWVAILTQLDTLLS